MRRARCTRGERKCSLCGSEYWDPIRILGSYKILLLHLTTNALAKPLLDSLYHVDHTHNMKRLLTGIMGIVVGYTGGEDKALPLSLKLPFLNDFAVSPLCPNNSIKRSNCYMVWAGESTSPAQGRNNNGLEIGCLVDTANGLLTFTANGKELTTYYQVKDLNWLGFYTQGLYDGKGFHKGIS